MRDNQLQLDVQPDVVERRYAPSGALDADCARLGRTWLSPREQAEMIAWRNPHRRQEWLRSRMLAKLLVAGSPLSNNELRKIEILRQSDSHRPRVLLQGEEQPYSLSISHSSRGVLVALSRRPEFKVGVDLADCEPLSQSLLRLWFTLAEIAWLREQAEPFSAKIVWATKEAIYKALNGGEGFDPRRIEALPHRCSYRGMQIDCQVHSCLVDDQIAVVVTAPIYEFSTFTVS